MAVVPLGTSSAPEKRRRTQLYLVCSPQAHVGKTLTARLLLDHLLGRGGTALGFDANHLEPSLATVFPRQTTVVDLGATSGQMALFDRLVAPDGIPKVVDLWHATYDLFWRQAADFGFFEEARRQGIHTLVFLQTDRRERFVREVAELSARWPRLKVILAHNEGLIGSHLQLVAHPEAWRADKLLVIPSLDEATRRILEDPRILVHKVLRSSITGKYADLQQKLCDTLEPVFKQIEFLELELTLAG